MVTGTALALPVVIGAVVGAGLAWCAVAGWAMHGREAMVAAVVVAIASEMAMLPLFLTRRSDQVTVAQAALGGTVLHLLATAGLSGLALGAAGRLEPTAWVGWTLAMYLATLATLATGMALSVKRARPTVVGTDARR